MCDWGDGGWRCDGMGAGGNINLRLYGTKNFPMKTIKLEIFSPVVVCIRGVVCVCGGGGGGTGQGDSRVKEGKREGTEFPPV